ncbi:maltase MalT [Zalerion maritima]|uniref:Maltase MalT n=1 Tax=Zalerion maritima TaxID=339359 RepID=A0AAD5RVF2_9PEZI|nr:maltase MalT [Zalerion maritima]
MAEGRCGNDIKDLERAVSALRYLGRDNARLPMPWDGEAPYAGWGDTKPWMKPHSNAKAINVKSQERDEESVLSFWKKMLKLRKENADNFVFGEFAPMLVQDPALFVYQKEDREERALGVLNFTDKSKSLPSDVSALVGDRCKLLVSNYDFSKNSPGLLPWEGRVYVEGGKSSWL